MMPQVSLSSEGLYPRKDYSFIPSRKLALGILVQAFRDALTQKNSMERAEWQKDALVWFQSESTQPGSLKWVCELLSIDPSSIRSWLRDFSRSDPKRQRQMARSVTRFHVP